jgi:dCTP deaminase
VILCDREINAALECGRLIIDPRPSQIDATSVDLHLGDQFYRWKRRVTGATTVIRPNEEGFSIAHLQQQFMDTFTGPIEIGPQEFVLGSTKERVGFPVESCLAARVEGRSTLARLGLGVHVTAPTIQSGFHGVIALEITNHGSLPIALEPGMRVCQLIIEQVFGTPGSGAKTRYVGQTNAVGS